MSPGNHTLELASVSANGDEIRVPRRSSCD
jgi:hypothetical protein